jgi:hypothetical protein
MAMAGAEAEATVDIPIDVHTAISSREYLPLPFSPILRHDFTLNGAGQNARTMEHHGLLAAEFLLVRGNLAGARLKLVDASASRVILDEVPAWLYAVPEMPLLRREGEVFIFVWPHQQPITHRLPAVTDRNGDRWPWLLPSYSDVTLTWYNLGPQHATGLEAVLLCRPMTAQEINSR